MQHAYAVKQEIQLSVRLRTGNVHCLHAGCVTDINDLEQTVAQRH